MKRFIALSLVLIFLAFSVGERKLFTEAFPPKLFNTLKAQYPKLQGTVRIMSYNLLSNELGFDGMSVESRKTGVLRLINSTNPDILGLQEMSRDWFSVFNKETNLKYTFPLCYSLSRSMTTLMYNPQTLTLLSYGSQAFQHSTNPRLRSYAWGLFEDKKTHLIFLALNTHLNLYEQANPYPLLQASELIEFCKKNQEKYNCPIFIMGDFNSKMRSKGSIDSTAFEYISLYYDNSQTAAKEKSYGEDKNLSSPTNDYIFYGGNCEILSFNILSQPELNVLSDHYPIFADVSLETKYNK